MNRRVPDELYNVVPRKQINDLLNRITELVGDDKKLFACLILNDKGVILAARSGTEAAAVFAAATHLRNKAALTFAGGGAKLNPRTLVMYEPSIGSCANTKLGEDVLEGIPITGMWIISGV